MSVELDELTASNGTLKAGWRDADVVLIVPTPTGVDVQIKLTPAKARTIAQGLLVSATQIERNEKAKNAKQDSGRTG